jgi:hypothetical protein
MQMWMPHYPLAYQSLALKNIIWGGAVYVDFVFFSKNAGTFNWTQWTHKVNEANKSLVIVDAPALPVGQHQDQCPFKMVRSFTIPIYHDAAIDADQKAQGNCMAEVVCVPLRIQLEASIAHLSEPEESVVGVDSSSPLHKCTGQGPLL